MPLLFAATFRHRHCLHCALGERAIDSMILRKTYTRLYNLILVYVYRRLLALSLFLFFPFLSFSWHFSSVISINQSLCYYFIRKFPLSMFSHWTMVWVYVFYCENQRVCVCVFFSLFCLFHFMFSSTIFLFWRLTVVLMKLALESHEGREKQNSYDEISYDQKNSRMNERKNPEYAATIQKKEKKNERHLQSLNKI